MWSEVCGTVFYKTVWNPQSGMQNWGGCDGKTNRTSVVPDCAEGVSVAGKGSLSASGAYSEISDRAESCPCRADSPPCGLQGRGAAAPQPAEEARRDNQASYAPSAEGEAEVYVCPPYEIYPDTPAASDISACRSLIHARAVDLAEARGLYGGGITAQKLNIFSLGSTPDCLIAPASAAGAFGRIPAVSAPAVGGAEKEGYVLVIEYYEAPTPDYPDGRLVTVAGGKVVSCGELPYLNGEAADGNPTANRQPPTTLSAQSGVRGFPFSRQVSIPVAGCFWGLSVLERCIPIQRAYNAVKNRKHEFLNRLASGVLAVEDGSVDVDNLEDEGLAPGKVLVYRQGSSPPRFMDAGHMPNEFSAEEDRLLAEFIYVSGVSEFMRNSTLPSSVTSGVQLQMLIEQDDSRISVSAESIRAAIRTVAQQILRLYKQFARSPRISRVVNAEGAVELLFWERAALTSDDVVFITENELSETPAQKRTFIFELLRAGLLSDENGKISNRNRAKILELLNFGIFEDSPDISALHVKKAAEENALFLAGGQAPEVRDIDDHDAHISEHTRFMLGGDYGRFVRGNRSRSEVLEEHIKKHRLFARLTAEAEGIR